MRWPNKLFHEHGLFNLKTARDSLLQS
jgi:hypothetical protein